MVLLPTQASRSSQRRVIPGRRRRGGGTFVQSYTRVEQEGTSAQSYTGRAGNTTLRRGTLPIHLSVHHARYTLLGVLQSTHCEIHLRYTLGGEGTQRSVLG